MEKNKEAVQLFTQGDTIFLYGTIGNNPDKEDWQSYDKYISDLQFIQALNEVSAMCSEVKIRMNCLGGSVIQGSAIIAAIQNCTKPIEIYVDGVAYSMAFNIFLSVPRECRHMSNVATLMCHEIRSVAMGTPEQLEQTAVGLRTMRDGTVQRMADEMGLTKEQVIAQYFDGKDHYFSYQQAVELGLIMPDDEESDYDAADIAQQTFLPPADPDDDNDIYMLNRFKAARALAIQQFSKQKSEEEMTINAQSIKDAIQKGEVSVEELDGIVKAEKDKQPLSAAALQEMITNAVQSAVTPLQEEITQLKQATPNSNPAAPNGADGNGGFGGEKTAQQLADEAKQKVNDIVSANGADFDTIID